MKTKTFFILCLLSGMCLTQVSAQKVKNYHWTGTWTGWWLPVMCNGVYVDYLYGESIQYGVDHYDKDGTSWYNYRSKGQAVSIDQLYGDVQIIGTGEVFTIKDNAFKRDPGEGPIETFTFNLNGNKGSHYIGTASCSYDTWEVIVIKCECN